MNRILIFLLLLSSIAEGQRGFFGGQTSFPYVRKNLIALDGGSTFVADAESGTLPAPFSVYGASDPGGVSSITRSTDFARFGTRSYKYIVNHDDAVFAGGVRAELSNLSDLVGYTDYGRCVGFSFLIPTSYVFETNPVLYPIIQQWHDNTFGIPGETEEKSSLELCLVGSKLSFTIRDCSTESMSDIHEQLANDYLSSMLAANPTLSKGVWYDIVYKVVFQDPHATNPHASGGLVQMWINGIQVANYSGKIGYHHTQSPFFKSGCYGWMYNPDGNFACCGQFALNQSITFYQDQIRIGNASANYNDVVP